MPRPSRRATRPNTSTAKDKSPIPAPEIPVHDSLIKSTPVPETFDLSPVDIKHDDSSPDDGYKSGEVDRGTLKDIGNQLSSNDQHDSDTDVNNKSDLSFHPSPPRTKHPRTTVPGGAIPGKPSCTVRTSELLTLLPERHARPHTISKSRARTAKSRKGTVDNEEAASTDKENDVYEEEDSEEMREREKRRKVVRKKFKEVDNWELEFESVDLSFSSQG